MQWSKQERTDIPTQNTTKIILYANTLYLENDGLARSSALSALFSKIYSQILETNKFTHILKNTKSYAILDTYTIVPFYVTKMSPI